jgi:hypothetical protein
MLRKRILNLRKNAERMKNSLNLKGMVSLGKKKLIEIEIRLKLAKQLPLEKVDQIFIN